jgi:nitroreductase
MSKSSVSALIESRVSTNHYDTARPMSDERIRELVELATHAPSAFNLQNWKFVAVRSAEGKQRLRALAFDQAKVSEAAVTIIVCGRLRGHTRLAEALKPAVDAGIMPATTADAWVRMAGDMYGENPQFQRDEAIRSASLAAMTLMLAAEGMGLSSGPMIGFDPDGVSKAFGLDADDVPAMLVTLGNAAPANWPQKPRLFTSDILVLA